ncbi:hypothetical protein HanXRQr2_Chr10g0462541 [Helianthus annuus]|uniref:Uncharacterized protein n=1 Tax=Helianthus annuus TaxID=4232 RepID=A0A9K3N5N3_HELAN|nr:hypothetical protein HanXRQr2_Chr10g0462541 [Helianthus annuus]KAJ0885543.1 hypothetical protein HanPSC8_Chr10g0446391 [Helianthus annuus]
MGSFTYPLVCVMPSGSTYVHLNNLQITSHIARNEAQLLLDIINQKRLIHNINRSITN